MAKTKPTNKSTETPVPTAQTNPPLDVMMKAAQAAEPKRRPVTYYKDIVAVLVLDKLMIAAEVRTWLSDHGAGLYPIAHVSPLVSAVRKEAKEKEQADAQAETQS